jgi:HlyD family secretion protein
MRTVVTLLVVGALLGPLVWWLTRPPPPVDVTVVSLEKGDVKLIINGSSAGEVMPEQRTMVRGEMAGTVERVLHKRGDRVKKGDSVVVLDMRDARARLVQAEAALEVAEVGVSSAQTRVNGAAKTLARMQQLVERGGAARAEMDRLEIERDASADGVRAAQAQVKQAQAALQVTRLALQRMELRAPFPGVLQDVMVNVGQQVTPGVPIFDIVDDSRLFIQVPMDEVDAPRVQLGQPVTVTFDSLRSREVRGVIRTVAPAIGRDEKLARTLRVEVELTEPPPMRVGMAANVAVVERVVEGVNVLPTLSVQGRGMERSVLVLQDVGPDGVGTVVRRKIRVGVSNDEVTEVASGLEAQDRVVHTPNDPSVKENLRARPVPLTRTATGPSGLAGLQDGRPPVTAAPSASGSP